MKAKKGQKNGLFIAAFGVGMLLAFFAPLKCLVILLSIAVIIMGLTSARYCR